MEAAAGSDAAFGFMSLSILALKKFRVAELLELCNFSMTITGRIFFLVPPDFCFSFHEGSFLEDAAVAGPLCLQKRAKKKQLSRRICFLRFPRRNCDGSFRIGANDESEARADPVDQMTH